MIRIVLCLLLTSAALYPQIIRRKPLASGSVSEAIVGSPVSCAGAEPQACAYTVIGVGNSLNVCLGNAAGDTVSVDATGMTFTAVSTLVSGNGVNLRCFRGATVGTGSLTVNCHGQFGDAVHCSIAEFSGVQTNPASDLDTSNTGTGASGTAMTTAAFTTTATDIIVAYGCNLGGGNVTAGGSFTLATSSSLCGMGYRLNVAAGSVTGALTGNSSNAWAIQGYGLKP